MEVLLNHLNAQLSHWEESLLWRPRPSGFICKHTGEVFPQNLVAGATGIKWLIVSFEKPCPWATSKSNQKMKSSPGQRRIWSPWSQHRLVPPLLAANANAWAYLGLGRIHRAIRTVLFLYFIKWNVSCRLTNYRRIWGFKLTSLDDSFAVAMIISLR